MDSSSSTNSSEDEWLLAALSDLIGIEDPEILNFMWSDFYSDSSDSDRHFLGAKPGRGRRAKSESDEESEKSESESENESGSDGEASDEPKAKRGRPSAVAKGRKAPIAKNAKATPAKRKAPTPPAKKKGATKPGRPVAKKGKKASSEEESGEGSEEDEEESGEEEESGDESDTPADKKAKRPPTDDEIKKYVKQILEGANLEQITMKTVCKQVYSHYPDFDLAHKKDFIKATVKSCI